MDKKTIGQLVDICYRQGGEKATVILSDRLKDIGFYYATLGGISISIDDMIDSAEERRADQQGLRGGKGCPEPVFRRSHHGR